MQSGISNSISLLAARNSHSDQDLLQEHFRVDGIIGCVDCTPKVGMLDPRSGVFSGACSPTSALEYTAESHAAFALYSRHRKGLEIGSEQTQSLLLALKLPRDTIDDWAMDSQERSLTNFVETSWYEDS